MKRPPPPPPWQGGGSTATQNTYSRCTAGRSAALPSSSLDPGLTPPESNTVSYTLAPAPIIPATSDWGLLVLTLLGLTAGTLIARGGATLERR